jgi:hypothetical protein
VGTREERRGHGGFDSEFYVCFGHALVREVGWHGRAGTRHRAHGVPKTKN